MERIIKRLLLASAIILIIFSFSFISCPVLEDTVQGETTITISGNLPYDKWVEILIEIDKQDKFVHLDLSNCAVSGSSTSGSAFFDHVYPSSTKIFRIFNTLPWLTDPSNPHLSGKEKDIVISAKNKIVSIVLPKSATMIDIGHGQFNSAFKDFKYLRSVKGENIEVIGAYAFYGLKHLREIDFPFIGKISETIPFDLAHIGEFAFAECSSLKRVSFPYAQTLGRNAFENSGLEKIELMDFADILTIEQRAFRGCSNLTSASFRAATKIGNEAFANCSLLETAVFNAMPAPPSPLVHPIVSVTPIGIVPESIIFYERVFIGCKNLKSLEIPNAWNVYFARDALANIGSHLDLYLFDERYTTPFTGRSFGHPQIEDFLGNRTTLPPEPPATGEYTRTIISIKFILPSLDDNESTIEVYPDQTISGKQVGTIYHDVNARYGEGAIKRTILRK